MYTGIRASYILFFCSAVRVNDIFGIYYTIAKYNLWLQYKRMQDKFYVEFKEIELKGWSDRKKAHICGNSNKL